MISYKCQFVILHQSFVIKHFTFTRIVKFTIQLCCMESIGLIHTEWRKHAGGEGRGGGREERGAGAGGGGGGGGGGASPHPLVATIVATMIMAN